MNDHDERLAELRSLDADVWFEVVTEVRPMLVRLARRMGVPSRDAEDVVQNGVIYTFRYFMRGGDVTDLVGCFRKGVRLATKDHYRRSKAKKRDAKVRTASNSKSDPMLMVVDTCVADPGERIGREESLQTLSKAIEQIDDRMANVIHLRLFKRLTFAQIAVELGFSTSTAMREFRQGLTQLRLILGHDGVQSPEAIN